MSKFEIGDNIKYVQGGANYLTVGRIYTVIGLDTDGTVQVYDDEGDKAWYGEGDFTPVIDFTLATPNGISFSTDDDGSTFTYKGAKLTIKQISDILEILSN